MPSSHTPYPPSNANSGIQFQDRSIFTTSNLELNILGNLAISNHASGGATSSYLRSSNSIIVHETARLHRSAIGLDDLRSASISSFEANGHPQFPAMRVRRYTAYILFNFNGVTQPPHQASLSSIHQQYGAKPSLYILPSRRQKD
jgi:hypothetical protein